MKFIKQSQKLVDVCYEIRGPAMREAKRMEAAGQKVANLNIGNPAVFGFAASEVLVSAVAKSLSSAQGYSDSRGVLSARVAVRDHYQAKGFVDVSVEDIFLGNGVSELIVMSLQGLLNDGDEVLVPSPDYPLWTAAVILAGGRPVHYLCDESKGWEPDLVDLLAKVTPRTRAVVVINPNNPTGAVYSESVLRGVAGVARKFGLVVMADEIYDKVLYDGAVHEHMALFVPDLLCLTFCGLSKSHRVAGFRSGWLVVSGCKDYAASYIEGLNVLASMRLCANVPAQYAIEVALGFDDSLVPLLLPQGRLLEQRNFAWEFLNSIPGVSCVLPRGALYLFPKLDLGVYNIVDDSVFVLDLLLQQKVLVVQGTGFNWGVVDHFRLVFLQDLVQLEDSLVRLAKFLEGCR